MKKVIKTYTEVELDNGKGLNRFYVNPFTRRYQYEYALLRIVSDLFKETSSSSLCPGRLKLYFNELPIRSEVLEESRKQLEAMGKKTDKAECTRKTQDSVMEEMNALVIRDVVGKVTFSMMNKCKAEIKVFTNADGTHRFIFTDGVYSFTVSIKGKLKGHPEAIIVKNYINGHAVKKTACD